VRIQCLAKAVRLGTLHPSTVLDESTRKSFAAVGLLAHSLKILKRI
jgi:hypothetical protein